MRLVARGLGFLPVAYYSGKVYKIGRVDEWTSAGAGGAVVVGSNPAQFMNFFFLFPFSKNF